GQVIAAAFLAQLDDDAAAGVRNVLLAQGANGRQRGEHGVAVIGAAAPVELAVLYDRLPGSEAFAPAVELRLLVQMTIEQNTRFFSSLRRSSWNFDEQQRRATLNAMNLHLHAFDGVLLAPLVGQL